MIAIGCGNNFIEREAVQGDFYEAGRLYGGHIARGVIMICMMGLKVIVAPKKLPPKTVSVQSAESVNNSFPPNWKPPYKPGTQVETIQLTQNSKPGEFVRVINDSNNPAGQWIVRAEDIAGLTPEQIQNKFSLPSTSTHMTDVILPQGTMLRTGIANGVFGFDGGGIQFDMMGQRIGDFVNVRPLP